MPDIPTEIQNQTFQVIYPPPVEEVDLNQDPQTVRSYHPPAQEHNTRNRNSNKKKKINSLSLNNGSSSPWMINTSKSNNNTNKNKKQSNLYSIFAHNTLP